LVIILPVEAPASPPAFKAALTMPFLAKAISYFEAKHERYSSYNFNAILSIREQIYSACSALRLLS